ncbi:tRNA (carboxymethyluridine(34)-5-O)-methyltransferase [Tolypocladium ophioglossoides CBS 100239]|uniref:tRNA (Carboxymethyluridine(34)-5-O)-methyltransferase n=1 Tax=Tolypocladium ophioglossoides (strain CBS 100239) TaxID=1163406 RepID=A0A0L0NJJ4_TOLOC|nr:tRNA (carboxymethyluridine(34)-5-O)-methyltransferase [Tolypocladium ophioglossoides CBS 100239]
MHLMREKGKGIGDLDLNLPVLPMGADWEAELPPSSSTADGNEAQKQSEPPEAPETYEETHVHAVYEAIAPHFSSTRHKPWPLVTSFLLSQRPGSIGLDVGCGNGKYLPVNPSVHLLGSDRSASLVHLARTERSGEVIVADGLTLPYRPAAVDFAISIAVVHHLSTRTRRRDAIAALLRCLRPGPDARALVYVWALEQGASRRGWDEGSEQDTLVPWVMRSKGAPQATYQRYYHLYRKGELEEDVRSVGGTVLESGYEKDNWWVICSR